MANVFAVPLGVDFAANFADGLVERFRAQPPDALARATIYANSKRMQTRIHDALIARGVRLLPRLRLVSDLSDHLILADLPPAAPPLRRRLQLAQFIRALMQVEPDIAPPAALQDLTDSLFDLIEEMDSEGLDPHALTKIDVSSHSAHWSRSQKFLSILVPFFAEGAPSGQGARRREAARRLAELWAAQPDPNPVFIAGSTGSRGEISLFMEAVARLPHGAVVLPGFDFDLPAQVWQRMDDVLTSEDHPQYRFRRLMDRIGLNPPDIQPWMTTTQGDVARNRLVSLALRPAPVTDQWLVDGAEFTNLPQTLANLSLIEAPSPREEAQAIALILRDAAERGVKAALITPDRLLSRRVTAALDRWGIHPDDSAGRPLALSAPGRFLRHLADMATERMSAQRLLVLLKHPMVMSGGERGPHLRLTRELELRLRRFGPIFPSGQDIIEFAARQTDDLAAPWAAQIANVMAMLSDNAADAPLEQHIANHKTLAETMARGLADAGSGELWKEAAGVACLALFETLSAEAGYGGVMSALEYRDLFTALLNEKAVQDIAPSHAGVTILGAREARECGADLVILAGLNEGSWPTMPPPDAWLNRAMRKQAGLLLPERQIGLAAHDFQQAIAAKDVVLCRATRSDESETVAARWLNRLTNLVEGLKAGDGPEALKQMRERGARWLLMAGQLDMAGPVELTDPRLRPARRPMPVPPQTSRPAQLNLTEVEKLIRDPYAIYARTILRLRPLDRLESEPDAGDRGTLFHKVLEHFVKDRPPEGESVEAAKTRFLATAETILQGDMPFPTQRALWLARLTLAADPLLAEDRRLPETVGVEITGILPIGSSGVSLKGRLDRVDRQDDGRLVLIDYKSGSLPSASQQKKFAKQLLAAAVMAERGAFEPLGACEVAEVRYVAIKPDGKVVETQLDAALKAATWDGLVKLLTHYRASDSGFTARRALMSRTDSSDYDHLSRYGEWDISDAAWRQMVGGADDE